LRKSGKSTKTSELPIVEDPICFPIIVNSLHSNNCYASAWSICMQLKLLCTQKIISNSFHFWGSIATKLASRDLTAEVFAPYVSLNLKRCQGLLWFVIPLNRWYCMICNS